MMIPAIDIPGSCVPANLQARTLEWVAISFSNAWKWKVKVKSLSRVWLLVTPWTAAYQAPPSMGFSRQVRCHCLLRKLCLLIFIIKKLLNQMVVLMAMMMSFNIFAKYNILWKCVYVYTLLRVPWALKILRVQGTLKSVYTYIHFQRILYFAKY